MWTPASSALPNVVCQSLSAAAPFIQSQQLQSSRIHSFSCSVSPLFPVLPRITSQCLAGCPHSSAPPHTLTSSHSASPLSLHPSTLLGLDEPLWDSSRWMGNKGVRGGPPLLVPLVSLPTRLWVIFSSFHSRAMNNLSLYSETQAPPQPPPLISPSADSPRPAAPRIASLTLAFDSLSLPSTPNQFLLLFFLFLRVCYKAQRLIGAVAGWHLVLAS